MGVINLNQMMSRKKMIEKIENLYDVEVRNCSDVVKNPYDAGSNFIAKMEVDSHDNAAVLLEAMERREIELRPYRYNSSSSSILSYIIDVVKRKSTSISELYE